MNPKPTPFLFGLFFILFGGFLLLGTTGIVQIDEEITVASIFAIAGLVMIQAHFLQKKPIWMLIVGGISLFIGTAVFIENTRIIPEESIGVLLFVIAAAIFLLQLRKGKEAWWAIIPGGFCLVMAGHVLLSLTMWHPEELHGALFFGGMGAIFGIIYLLKDENYNLGWAKWPALSALIMSAFILFVNNDQTIGKLFFPLILIFFGGIILFKSMHRQHNQDIDSSSVSTTENEDIVQ
ncbi:hypothetical protein KAR48_03485 [bacterium]|nr:hypothetical protein [bacterium]